MQQTGCSELVRKQKSGLRHGYIAARIYEPRCARDTDGGDGAAGDADERGDVLNNDTEEREERGRGGGVSLLGAVAALQGAGVALVGRRAGGRVAARGRRCGSSKGRKCESGEGGELGEVHDNACGCGGLNCAVRVRMVGLALLLLCGLEALWYCFR